MTAVHTASVRAPAPVLDEPLQPLVIDSGPQHIRVQLCLSPLCSTIASLIEVSGRGWAGPPDGWRSIVGRAGIEPAGSPLAFYTGYPYIPRFLLPRLHDPAPAFTDQLDDIVATTDDEIRRDLADTFGPDVPPAYLPFLSRPRQELARTAETLAAYHQAVIAPRWPAMRQVLERDVLRLAYVLTTRGIDASLNQVHPAIAYTGGRIQLSQAGASPSPNLLGDRLLMLTPLVCDPAGVIADLGDRTTVKIGYAAPAARAVWSARPDPALAPRRRLCELLGETRAAILARLDGPATTTALSVELQLAPSTVSEHLAHLGQIDLVARTRQGREVQYTRTGTGDRLLELFS